MRRRVAGSVALTAISQIAVMVLGGVLAILLAAKVGSNARTDGLFAAYGVYAIVVLLAQSARLTVVSRLVASPTRFAAFDSYLAATLLTFVVTGVFFVALGGPLSELLTGSLPAEAPDTSQTALAILWPAAGCHLVAALCASMLGVLGDYRSAAASYSVGGVASIVAFLALYPSLGVDALAVAILIGAGFTMAPLPIVLARAGWRPRAGVFGEVGAAARRAWTVVLASVPILLLQALYVISVAFVARIGTGEVTAFTYAFFALGLVIALTSSSVSIVLAAPLAATWDRRPESLRVHVDDVFRAGLLLLAPIVAAAGFVGEDVAAALLANFSAHDVDQIVRAFGVMAPAVVGYQALAIPLIALFALGRYAATSLVAVAVMALHVVLSFAGYQLGGLAATVVAVPVSLLTFALAGLVLLYGRATAATCAHLGVELARVALPAAACFGLALLALAALDVAAGAAYAIGLALYVVIVAAAMPTHRALVLRAADSLRAQAVGDA